jgi:LacI family transcriptional regulator
MYCRDLAQGAVASLIARMQPMPGKPDAPTKTSIPTRLIVRQTTGLPKGAMSDLVARTG